MGDEKAEGSTMGDRRQAILLMPDVDGMHVCSFESLKPEGFYERDLMMFGIFLASYCVLIAMTCFLEQLLLHLTSFGIL